MASRSNVKLNPKTGRYEVAQPDKPRVTQTVYYSDQPGTSYITFSDESIRRVTTTDTGKDVAYKGEETSAAAGIRTRGGEWTTGLPGTTKTIVRTEAPQSIQEQRQREQQATTAPTQPTPSTGMVMRSRWSRSREEPETVGDVTIKRPSAKEVVSQARQEYYKREASADIGRVFETQQISIGDVLTSSKGGYDWSYTATKEDVEAATEYKKAKGEQKLQQEDYAKYRQQMKTIETIEERSGPYKKGIFNLARTSLMADMATSAIALSTGTELPPSVSKAVKEYEIKQYKESKEWTERFMDLELKVRPPTPPKSTEEQLMDKGRAPSPLFTPEWKAERETIAAKSKTSDYDWTSPEAIKSFGAMALITAGAASMVTAPLIVKAGTAAKAATATKLTGYVAATVATGAETAIVAKGVSTATAPIFTDKVSRQYLEDANVREAKDYARYMGAKEQKNWFSRTLYGMGAPGGKKSKQAQKEAAYTYFLSKGESEFGAYMKTQAVFGKQAGEFAGTVASALWASSRAEMYGEQWTGARIKALKTSAFKGLSAAEKGKGLFWAGVKGIAPAGFIEGSSVEFGRYVSTGKKAINPITGKEMSPIVSILGYGAFGAATAAPVGGLIIKWTGGGAYMKAAGLPASGVETAKGKGLLGTVYGVDWLEYPGDIIGSKMLAARGIASPTLPFLGAGVKRIVFAPSNVFSFTTTSNKASFSYSLSAKTPSVIKSPTGVPTLSEQIKQSWQPSISISPPTPSQEPTLSFTPTPVTVSSPVSEPTPVNTIINITSPAATSTSTTTSTSVTTPTVTTTVSIPVTTYTGSVLPLLSSPNVKLGEGFGFGKKGVKAQKLPSLLGMELFKSKGLTSKQLGKGFPLGIRPVSAKFARFAKPAKTKKSKGEDRGFGKVKMGKGFKFKFGKASNMKGWGI